MSDKYLLDTNILLRLVLSDNENQWNEIYALFEKAERGEARLFCDVPSLFEFCFVLSGEYYDLSKKEIVEKLKEILDLKIINFFEKTLFLTALEIYEFNDSNLSIIDCFLIARCKDQDLKLFSFDKKAKRVEESWQY